MPDPYPSDPGEGAPPPVTAHGDALARLGDLGLLAGVSADHDRWGFRGMIEPMSESPRSRLRGPRRPAGSPAGPDEVRRAVLDAAATLFALRGVDAVSLRDIAAAADVHLELIRLYVGTREELVLAVYDYLSDQVARAVAENPLSGQGFEPDTVMGKWVRVAGALAIAGRPAGRPVQPGAGHGQDPGGGVRARFPVGAAARGADRGGCPGLADLRGLPCAGRRP